ncbi:MAG: NAD(P)-dependent oxidoreductase [Spirochaetes bacterium]|nr:NAD(P)-dependent oxidoreductase [Spirochaetota bacterium]
MTVQGTHIAFIGIGVMGKSMCSHLMRAGAIAHVHNRTKSKTDDLVTGGAIWHDSPKSAASAAAVIFTMVGYPSDVEEVYFGTNGIFAGAKAGTILVDTTTSRPDLAVRIHGEAAAHGFAALDAPVSGGDIGAKNATLTIMVGGDQAVFDSVKPFFEIMGKVAVLQGPAGSGQHTKMANQIAIAGSLAGAVEAVIYAEKNGLDPRRVLTSISGGSAGSWQLQNMVPRMLDGNFEPGFFVKHFLKDLRIALDAANSSGATLPVLSLAERFFSRMSETGYAELGTHALYLLYKRGEV